MRHELSHELILYFITMHIAVGVDI